MMGDRAGRLGTALVGVAVLVMSLAGCGGDSAASEEEEGKASKPAPYASTARIPVRMGSDGTTIQVGDPNAPVVHVYEDPRCPVCKEVEVKGAGPKLEDLTKLRTVSTEYTLASFLDDKLGGSGSQRAVNALRAALEQGKFLEYHRLIFKEQPNESVDGFTDAYLLKLADQVEGLRGPAFDSAVKSMKYRKFVAASQRAFEHDGMTGTPNMTYNGRVIPGHLRAALFDKSLFVQLIDQLRSASPRPAYTVGS